MSNERSTPPTGRNDPPPVARGRIPEPRRVMAAFSHHIFICGKGRKAGASRGSCDPHEEEALRGAFKKELKRAGLSRATRTQQTGCLDQCEHGPVVVIYPQGVWYGGVGPADVPRIVERTIARGEVLPDLLIADSCLNNPDCPHRAGR